MASPTGFVLPGLALGAGAITFSPNPRGFFPDASNGPVRPIVAQATVEEIHDDELEITDHPIEVGSPISDHAYKRPVRVAIRCAWSNSPSPPASIVGQALGIVASIFGNPIALLAAAQPTISAAQSLLTGNSAPSQVKSIYQQLRALQDSLVPFTILTGKRQYRNMLFQSLRVDTNERSENSLVVTAVCREVILVTTSVAPLSAAVQADPASTAEPQAQGSQAQQPAPTASPDPGTVSGALGDVQAGFTQLTSTMNGVLPTLAEVQGPLAQLPAVIQSAGQSLSTVVSQWPAPAEIPLIPAAQTLSIPLGAPDLGADFSTALRELPGVLTEANTGLVEAAKQLPTVSADAAPVLSSMGQTMTQVQGQIANALVRLERIGVH